MTDPTIRRQRELEARQRRREQLRLAEEIAQRRQNMRRRSEPAADNQRLAALENEWRGFKAGVAQAQRQQHRRALFQQQQKLLAELELKINPPQPPAQEA